MFTTATMTNPDPGSRASRSDGTVARYNLINAWPNSTAAGGNDVLQQEWSIVYETIQR